MAFANAVLKNLCVYVEQHSRRVINVIQDFEDLNTQVNLVSAHWEDLDKEIQSLSSFRQINKQYTDLQNKVCLVVTTFMEIKQQYEQFWVGFENQRSQQEGSTAIQSFRAEHTAFKQRIWTPKFFKLAKLDKDVNKLMPIATALLKELTEPKDLTIPLKPKIVLRLIAEELDNVGESHQRHLNKLLEYIDKYNRIGIYGNPDILQNLRYSFSVNSKFDCFIWVTVGRKQTTEENIIASIQQEIIERLKLPDRKITITENSETISSALSGKKYLLLLDDFRPGIKLEDIGIHKEHNDGKVVMRVHNLEDLKDVRHELDAYPIELKPLSVEELWSLFKDSLTVWEGLCEEQAEIADKILEKLRRFPGFIKSVATRLSEYPNDLLYWQGLLKRLEHKDYPFHSFAEETENKEIEADRDLSLEIEINTSNYSASEGSPIGNTTGRNPSNILPSLYEEEIDVERFQAAEISRRMDPSFSVIVSVAGELSDYLDLKFEMLHGSSSETDEFKYSYFTSEADSYCILMREKAGAMEGDLSSTKLTESSKNTSIKLPERLILQKSGHRLTSPPEEEIWRQASVMNLRDNAVSSLSLKRECPNLVLVFLQRNMCLRKIEDSFFRCMPILRVLDLSDNRLKSLPSSLFKLDKLQILILRNCKFLDSLPKEIKGLKGLEVLDLHGTKLHKIPDEVGHLIHLRQLQITFNGTDDEEENQYLRHLFLSPNIISKLLSLQLLSIAVHPEDIRWIRNANAIMGDLARLNSLSYLEFYFPKVELVEQLVKLSPWKNICTKKFRFVVGQNVKRIVDRVSNDVEIKFNQHSRCLRYVNGDSLQEAIKEVLKYVTALYLDHHLTMRNLSEMGITTSKEIKFCTVRECPNVEVVIDGEIHDPAYPSLEHLGMHYLWKLESICRNPLVKGSFCSLKCLIIDTCPKLKFIMCESMLESLSNLEELEVEDCECVEEIIRKSDEDEERGEEIMEITRGAVLPRLSKLRLSYLPRLRRFWWKLGAGGTNNPLPKESFKALEYATVWLCTKLDLVSFKSMKEDFEIVYPESASIKHQQQPQAQRSSSSNISFQQPAFIHSSSHSKR